jgi:hypothetical protein
MTKSEKILSGSGTILSNNKSDESGTLGADLINRYPIDIH